MENKNTKRYTKKIYEITACNAQEIVRTWNAGDEYVEAEQKEAQDFEQRPGTWARLHENAYKIQLVQKAMGAGECVSECNKDGCTECSNSGHIISCAKWGIKNDVGRGANRSRGARTRCYMKHDIKHHMQRITYGMNGYMRAAKDHQKKLCRTLCSTSD